MRFCLSPVKPDERIKVAAPRKRALSSLVAPYRSDLAFLIQRVLNLREKEKAQSCHTFRSFSFVILFHTPDLVAHCLSHWVASPATQFSLFFTGFGMPGCTFISPLMASPLRERENRKENHLLNFFIQG